MTIKDKVWGNIEIPKKYECIINTNELQRLKNKKQLGMTKGNKAIHTRFEHSIGVYNLACKLIAVVQNKLGDYIEITSEEEDAIKIMALVHDIGHGPFSHLAERLLSGSHEDNTVRLLKEDTSIHQAILNNFGNSVLEKVIYLIELKEKIKNNEVVSDKPDIMFIISKLLSGGIDIDRLDYIARDSYHLLNISYDYSDILNHINLDYIDDYLEIVFDESAEYLIANYLNKRYELYDTVYLDDQKFIVESYLDKILKEINYQLNWDTEEKDILNYLELIKSNCQDYQKRLIDIVLKREVDDDIKYMIFDNIDAYKYFLSDIMYRYQDLPGIEKSIITTDNKLNIYSQKNRIYINHGNLIKDMSDCAILNSNLKRNKYIVGIDFAILSHYCSNVNAINELKNYFLLPIELEKKYIYESNGYDISKYKQEIIKCLGLEKPEFVVNKDTYYDNNNDILKQIGMTLRNRITFDKNIWNIKEKISDKSSVTKRIERTFSNFDEVREYLLKVWKINITNLEEKYSSTTNREQYQFICHNSKFEIAFDDVNLNTIQNNINFPMIECELKEGCPIDLYYLNNIMHQFPFLIDCTQSKSEIVLNQLNKINVKKKIKDNKNM